MNSVLSGRRVLVMEDEMLVAWALEDMLADLGCIVVGPAARVDKALALLHAEAVDLAMLDVNLNGQRSYPVADALAAKGVPFVFLTGYTRDSLPDCYHRLARCCRNRSSRLSWAMRLRNCWRWGN